MCGRYDLSENPAAIRAKFRVPSDPAREFAFPPNPDVRPTDRPPIVRLGADGECEIALARWGLVPMWAKDLKFGARCVNARGETLATSLAYRAAFGSRRCLVPVSAFYEWTGPKGKKTRWRIALRDEPLFALAGLWEWWRDPARPAAVGVETFTIVTCAANAALAPLHDRMPVIVAPEAHAQWLDATQDGGAIVVSREIDGLTMAAT